MRKEIAELAAVMAERGWNGTFLAAGSYPGSFEESLGRYIGQAELGREPGIGKGIGMATYAQWKDSLSENVACWFAIRHDAQGGLHIAGVEIARNDRYGKALEETCLVIRSNAQVPSVQNAIAMVNRPRVRQGLAKGIGNKRRRRIQ